MVCPFMQHVSKGSARWRSCSCAPSGRGAGTERNQGTMLIPGERWSERLINHAGIRDSPTFTCSFLLPLPITLSKGFSRYNLFNPGWDYESTGTPLPPPPTGRSHYSSVKPLNFGERIPSRPSALKMRPARDYKGEEGGGICLGPDYRAV